MEGITLADVIAAAQGDWLGSGDPSQIRPTGCSIDTRTLKPGDVFFALPGERVDGHGFVDSACEKGAAAVIVSRQWCKNRAQNGPLIAVDAPERALGDLGRAYRKRFDIPVVGITGSNGKTTTKDMVAAVLGTRYAVLATEGNLNNHLGVPLMVSRLSGQHGVAVFEMGINRHGELSYLCDIAQPNIGIITNIGPTHLEFLGSVEGVAKAKGELLEYLDESSMTILNLDDLLLSKERAKVKGRLLGFGIEQICQFRGEGLTLDREGCGYFSLQGRCFHVPIPGRHNVYNALAAIAAGYALGVPLEDAAEALNAFKPTKLRSQVMTRNGVRLINDAYNANPASMRAALAVLSSAKPDAGGRRIALLGDMLELGDIAQQAHRDLGAEAARHADAVFALGPMSGWIVEGARQAGLAQAQAFEDRNALVDALQNSVRPGDVLLAKGSRGIAVEQVVKALGFEI